VRKIWKITVRILLGVFVLLLVSMGGGLGYRAYRQRELEQIIRIPTANGVDEGMFVRIGGVDQWITIRGRDRENPVLLILHGGPGGATSAFALDTLSWEAEFTLVQWDQRGAGKTFGKSGAVGPEITIERMAQDGLEVAEFVRDHLHKPRIILLGISWGSILGVHMAKARPELFYAYVGTGQAVNERKGDSLAYQQLLVEANARNDRRAIRELETIGPPPWDKQSKLGVRSKWANAYETGAPSIPAVLADGLMAPRSSLSDFYDWARGFQTSQDHFLGDDLSGPLMAVDLSALGTDFAVPVFVFQGEADHITPAQLARSYVENITAPQKELVPIPGAGHLAMLTRNNVFLRLLVEQVRPLAMHELEIPHVRSGFQKKTGNLE
jgi:pimeloyl-ACP methyl ester carboxylesterase